MQETWVWSLGGDLLEKGSGTSVHGILQARIPAAIHYSSTIHFHIHPLIPWTEEPGGLQSMGSERIRHNWSTNTRLPHTSYIHTCSNPMIFSKVTEVYKNIFRALDLMFYWFPLILLLLFLFSSDRCYFLNTLRPHYHYPLLLYTKLVIIYL